MATDFTMTLLVDQSPRQVFNAVLNVRQWWSGLYAETIEGKMKNLNDEFSFRAGEGAHYTKQKLIEVIPDKKIVWLVTHSELTFIEKQDEWENTRISFHIQPSGEKTQLRFTHHGLTPAVECYEACSSAWSMYLKEKLLTLIESTSKN
jgi:hypothetical protein